MSADTLPCGCALDAARRCPHDETHADDALDEAATARWWGEAHDETWAEMVARLTGARR